MRKENPLRNHLLDPQFQDEPSRLVLLRNSDRLWGHYPPPWPGGWREVAAYIAGRPRWPVTWFPDANVALRDDTEAVWDALRIAGIGSHTPTTVITGVVEAEVSEWLKDPWHHKERAKAIGSALGGKTWIGRYCLGPESSFYPAIFGYTHLLGIRRAIAGPCREGLTFLGTDPAAKCEAMNAIRNEIGTRAQGLAKKGRIDAETKGVMYLDDELHCLLVITHALTTGKESVLLTADEDLPEVFWKAQWFFDTHYRAWLAGKIVKEGRYGQPAGELEDTRGYFEGPLLLYRRYTTHLREVLPSLYSPVPVHVVYVAPDRMIHRVTFCFEREMVGLLEMRSKTGGRCTDLFGEANIHVDLGPLKTLQKGLHLGIGRDAGQMVETAGRKTFLAVLDQAHSISCQERRLEVR